MLELAEGKSQYESPSSEKVPVGVLGATGIVGQRFIGLLSNHPWFQVVAIGASSGSAGRIYGSFVKWRIPDAKLSTEVEKMVVGECTVEHFAACKYVFSALDASVAGPIEAALAQAGKIVFSNAKNHRMVPSIPLIIPLANPEHLLSVTDKHDAGLIVTNSNCTTTGVAVLLKAVAATFGPIQRAFVTSMQAVSGAGLTGVAAMDSNDNVIPFIEGEEEKISVELQKILGTFDDQSRMFLSDENLKISASCNRVPVLDGHLCSVSFELVNGAKPNVSELIDALRAWKPLPKSLPHCPEQAIWYLEEKDRPQPRLDRNIDAGFAVVVGRLRKCEVLDFKASVLINNTVIGAAGASILNAELYHLKC